jgi:aspartate 1-decarboxylase
MYVRSACGLAGRRRNRVTNPIFLREMLKSKIHRATVTQADLHYVGSITIDADLMAAADLLPGEKVDVVDVDNGNRLSTYVIEGPAGSGVIGINGAAARLVSTGDLVIVISYAQVSQDVLAAHRPQIVFVDGQNRQISIGADPADPGIGAGLVRGDRLETVFG